MSTPYYPPPTPAPGPGPGRKSRSSGALVALIALVVLCGAAGAVLVVVTTDKSGEKTEATEEAPANVAAVPVSAGTTPPPPVIEPLDDEIPAEITVSIVTTPAGAEVFSGGESVGTTPITKRFPKAEEQQTWQVFLDGYEVEEVDVGLDADFHSELVLKELAPEAPPVQKPIAAKPKTQRRRRTDPRPAVSKTAKSDAKEDEKKSRRRGGKTPVKASERRGDEEHKVITRTTGASVPD